jgi:Holliday junction DNA helicase RuvA
MIARLRGALVAVGLESIILDVQGVGYGVTISRSVSDDLPNLGDELTLVIFTDVKENDISLYGFSSDLEKHVFLLLKKVKGVGSKLAIKILAAIEAKRILVAIGQSDVAVLTKIPGVGKKTAERVVVELREQVGDLVSVPTLSTSVERLSSGDSGPITAVESGPVDNDAVLALEKLGFPLERARVAVAEASKTLGAEISQQDAGDLLREALSRI